MDEAEKKQAQTISHNLKKLRKLNGLTQIQLAELSGVAHGSIQKYERGIQIPRWENLVKLSNALGCSILEIDPSKTDWIESSSQIGGSVEEQINANIERTLIANLNNEGKELKKVKNEIVELISRISYISNANLLRDMAMKLLNTEYYTYTLDYLEELEDKGYVFVKEQQKKPIESE
jgi:transcriptional regulator with XRE-family HTH domain